MERTGLDDQHPDAEPVDLLGQRFRPAFERELRRRVRADTGKRESSTHAAHLHDRAGAPLTHLRQHRTCQRRRSEEVQMHQVAQLGVGGLLCGADRAAAGVVDQDVDASVSVEHLADGGGDAVGVCDVELQRGDPVGVGLDEIGHRVGPARRGHHGVACRQRRFSDRATEPRGGAGDEPHPCLCGCHICLLE